MIGDSYKIKYSDYTTNNSHYMLIDATDPVNRPGVNTTNFNTLQKAPNTANQNIDLTFYGYRSQGYGAALWNNLFYLLENFAQPSNATSTIPLYSADPIVGQIWVDKSTSPPVSRWYGRDNTFRKLGAAIDIAPSSDQVQPGEMWFDNTKYTFNFYNTGWTNINCIPYASQTEYNQAVHAIQAITSTSLTTLTGSVLPTSADWTTLISTIRALAAANNIDVTTFPASIWFDQVANDNFMNCNSTSYGIETIEEVFSSLQSILNQVTAAAYPPVSLPIAGFTSVGTSLSPNTQSPSAPAIPYSIVFTDTSVNTGGYITTYLNAVPTITPEPAVYTWDFGDGTTATVTATETPGTNQASIPPTTHVYTTEGTFTVKLTVTNSKGSTSSEYSIRTYATPVANFSAGPHVGTTPPISVQFTDMSTHNPTNWSWNFGDGTLSSAQNPPTHAYHDLGDFTVSLTVSNVAGSSTSTIQHQVTVGSTPIANFTYSPPTSPTEPFSVSFTDTSLNTPKNWTDPNTNVSYNGWLWDFGDGNTSNEQNPTHTYAHWGRFNVSLAVQNPVNIGQNASPSVKTINQLVVVGLAPSSSFTVAASTGNKPLTVTFTDTSQNHPDTWHWDFGDGNTSTQQNPTHTYTSQGRFTVTLAASNVVGTNTVAIANAVQVGNNPVASFTTSVSTGPAPLSVNFYDTSTNIPEQWHWDFGDGGTSNIQNPSYVYQTTGTYTVTLTATNPLGSSTSTTIIHTVVYIDLTLPTTTSMNVNIATALSAAGWDGKTPVVSTITIPAGVQIGSTSTLTYALQTGTNYPAGSHLTINNAGMILGRGGDGGSSFYAPTGNNGGPAVLLQTAVTFNNTGIVGGGGGGGGGGMNGAWGPYDVRGSGGGGGAGDFGGTAGGWGGSAANTALYAATQNGVGGLATTGGAGGEPDHGFGYGASPTNYINGGRGGAGGALGSPGQSGSPATRSGEGWGGPGYVNIPDYAGTTVITAAGTGGAAGAAVVGRNFVAGGTVGGDVRGTQY